MTSTIIRCPHCGMLAATATINVTIDPGQNGAPQNDQPKPDMATLARPIDSIEWPPGLRARILNCMQNENIRTFGDLCIISEAELLRAPNLGRKSVDAVKAALTSLSLRLGMET
jgi:DNA-directed RNA polymerase subunit alpha